MSWWPAILGWPALVLALGLSIFGIVRRRAIYLYTAMVLVLPISGYLAASPRFPWLPMLIPLGLLGTGLAVRYDHPKIAIVLTIVVVLYVSTLAMLVLTPLN